MLAIFISCAILWKGEPMFDLRYLLPHLSSVLTTTLLPLLALSVCFIGQFFCRCWNSFPCTPFYKMIALILKGVLDLGDSDIIPENYMGTVKYLKVQSYSHANWRGHQWLLSGPDHQVLWEFNSPQNRCLLEIAQLENPKQNFLNHFALIPQLSDHFLPFFLFVSFPFSLVSCP